VNRKEIGGHKKLGGKMHDARIVSIKGIVDIQEGLSYTDPIKKALLI